MSDDVMTEAEIVSMIDAEMSRLKGLLRVAERERDVAVERMRIAEDKADDFKCLAESDAAEFNRRQAVWTTRVAAAERLGNSFISKTTNLVMMRCTYCEHEWVRDCKQEHDTDCPVGLVFDAPAAHQAAPTEPDAQHAGEGE